MKITGIIAEYNPFHYGHVYHIQETRKKYPCDLLIVCMAGNFVQRGEMSIAPKLERVKMALQYGVDIVVELPYPFVMQRADRFAFGGVHTLQQMGIDTLSFGSESCDLTNLENIALEIANEDCFRLDKQSSVKTFQDRFHQLKSNDLLGVFYLKALLNLNINPLIIQRSNHYHSQSIKESIASASAIRHAILANKDIRHTTPMKNLMQTPFHMQSYFGILKVLLLTLPNDYLKQIFLMDEGIENLFKKKLKVAENYETFIRACTSSRYPKSTLNRALMHLLTQTRKQEIDSLETLDFVRLLGFNKKAQPYLRILQDSKVNIISSFQNIPKGYREIEERLLASYYQVVASEASQALIKAELLSPIIV